MAATEEEVKAEMEGGDGEHASPPQGGGDVGAKAYRDEQARHATAHALVARVAKGGVGGASETPSAAEVEHADAFAVLQEGQKIADAGKGETDPLLGGDGKGADTGNTPGCFSCFPCFK